MASLFRKPDEATSTDSDHVTDDLEYKVQTPESNAFKDNQTKPPEDARALSPPAGRSSAPIITLPNLTQHQRESLFHISLVEQQCKAAAKDILNKPEEPSNYLQDGHPDVKSLTAVLFAPLAKEWSDKTGLSADLIGENAAAFRDALTTSFKDFLNKAAAKELRGLESSSSPKTLSADLMGLRVASQGSPFYPNIGSGSAPSLISGASRSPFKVESVYESEYHEISPLGQGSYGHVFRVRNHLDEQEYAIKKIVITSQRIKRYMETDQIDALLAEVRTLAKLNHANIVRYFHAWVEYKTQNAHSTSTAVSEKRIADHRMLPEPETQETGTGYGLTDSLDDNGFKQYSKNGEGEDVSQDFGQGHDQEIHKDDVVFGYSSAHHSRDSHIDSGRVRRASHTTTTSNRTLQTSVLSIAEDDNDPEVENIPRTAAEIGQSFSNTEMSAMRVAIEQPPQSAYGGPDINLYIKMSLHPMTLLEYLSPAEAHKNCDAMEIRHCFHQDSSIGMLDAILDGLDYLHSQGIVHRDVKPANIFLSIHQGTPPALKGCVNIMGCAECARSETSKRVYVTPCIGDFGLIAEYKEPLKRTNSDFETPLFEPSRLAALQQKPVGTLFYRPAAMPKQEPVICPKLDVYSLGVIALELIYKFDTKSERAIVLAAVKRGILPAELKAHPMVGGIKSMVCQERDTRWDCIAVRKWLGQMHGKGKAIM